MNATVGDRFGSGIHPRSVTVGSTTSDGSLLGGVDVGGVVDAVSVAVGVGSGVLKRWRGSPRPGPYRRSTPTADGVLAPAPWPRWSALPKIQDGDDARTALSRHAPH